MEVEVANARGAREREKGSSGRFDPWTPSVGYAALSALVVLPFEIASAGPRNDSVVEIASAGPRNDSVVEIASVGPRNDRFSIQDHRLDVERAGLGFEAVDVDAGRDLAAQVVGPVPADSVRARLQV